MTNKFCDSPIHKVSSLALAFIILSFCVLPSFASADSIRPNEPIGYKDGDTFRDIIVVVLDSWGISFSSATDNSLLDDMDSLLDEFYTSQNSYANEFWDNANYGINKLGQLILDHTTVGKIIQFAQWLISEYNLQDNSEISTVPPVEAGYYFLDGTPFLIGGSDYSSWANASLIANDTLYYLTNGTSFRVFYNNGTRYLQVFRNGNMNLNAGPGNYPYNTWIFQTDSDGKLWLRNYPIQAGVALNPSSPSDFFGPTSSPTPDSGIFIITDVIDIPTVSPDDGLQVSVPGTNWGDSLFDILNLIERLIGLYDNTQLEIISIVETLENLIPQLVTTVSVDNIPGGVILDYDEYDIPLENEWGLFDLFFNTGGDEITLLRPWQELRSIIYGFPTPILSFFALVVLFIVAYGFIRMGRDSH